MGCWARCCCSAPQKLDLASQLTWLRTQALLLQTSLHGWEGPGPCLLLAKLEPLNCATARRVAGCSMHIRSWWDLHGRTRAA
jgi:hypothetical protein